MSIGQHSAEQEGQDDALKAPGAGKASDLGTVGLGTIGWRWATPLGRQLAISGFVATSLIVAGGVATGPHPAGSDIPALGWMYPLLRSGGGTLGSYLAVYGGVALVLLTWIRTGRACRNGELDTTALITIAVVWALPLVVGPPMFSRDVFSYAAQGRMVVVGLNPYTMGPVGLGSGQYLNAVPHIWASARVPYGPLFVGLDAGIVRMAGQNMVAAILGLRAIGLLGVVLVARYLPRMASRLNVNPAIALWLGLLNPLTLLHLIGGAHNDALMLGLLVAGLAMALEGRVLVSLVLCTLAAAIKVPAAAGVAYVTYFWIQHPGRQRISPARLLGAAAVVAGTFAAVSQAVGLGWGWIGAVTTPEQVRTVLSPVTALGLGFGGLIHLLGLPLRTTLVLRLFRVVGLGAAAMASAVFLGRSQRLGMVRSLGLTLMLIVVLGPVIQPWYLTWGLVLLAATGGGWLRPTLVWGTVALSFAVLPNGTGIALPLMLGIVATTAAVLFRTWQGRPVPESLAWLDV
ncbi:MAG: polyprenol phosphomannose-dependent alpha 1,6 mannosyltransferase MptB [Acidimicrobiales bacterium]